MAEKSASNEIAITRMYDAPVKTVWEAWTDSDQVGRWWGPRGFTLTTHSKELKPGGTWRYTMHGPDGADYVNVTRYLEVEKYSRLVYDHGGNDEKAPLFRVTVNFTDVKGKTKMDMRMTLPTPQAAEETRVFIKKAGGNSTWDRLAEYLAKESAQKELFIINRSFDAPIETLFDLWTQPDHLCKWLPPTGFTMRFQRVEIREGGSGFFEMTDGGKVTMYGTIQYLEIRRPKRLVYTQQFSDAKGNVSRHPLAPSWPETMRTTVEFTEEGPAQTRVTVTWEVAGKATREEMDTFIQGRAGMTQGWTGSFDKLENLVAETEAVK